MQPKVKEDYGDWIIQLRSNKLPNGLITLENLFDHDDAKNDKWKLTADKGDYIKMSVAGERMLKVRKEVPLEDRKRLTWYCDEYVGVLAWSYEYLKGYNPNIIQNMIEIADGAKPVRQKQRPVNSKIESLMAQELKKLIESKIIYPIKHNTWVSNLVPVRKKNGDILLCVDFRDLNQASLKHHYPLPPMEQLLSTGAGSEMFTMLDNFSGYNQVLVKPEDQHKTTFTTK